MHNQKLSNTPFFIIGCVRSGTTMLRDILRLHPRLECPEETHFYRWSDPFATPRYLHPYRNNPDIRKQQDMDGFSKEEFEVLLEHCHSRRELSEAYGQGYLEKIGNPQGRWFDKTPQNIYGLSLIGYQFPESKIIHIYRNPLNVVASLVKGNVMSIPSIKAGINYWKEAMALVHEFRKIHGDRLIEIQYEKIAGDPEPIVDQLMQFLGEDRSLLSIPEEMIYKERNQYPELLSDDQVALIKQACEPFYSEYGYS